MSDLPPPSLHAQAEQLAGALVSCGLSKDGFVVTYVGDLQSYEIKISANAGATAENLQCVWQAAHLEFVEFEEPQLGAAFDKLTEDRYLDRYLDAPRKSLAVKGLLDGLPHRANFTSLADFLRALESHCGAPAETLLEVHSGFVTVQAGICEQAEQSDKVSCLLSAMMLVAAEDKSVKFGFIGNELSTETGGK